MPNFQKFALGTGIAALAAIAWFDAFITILERTGG